MPFWVTLALFAFSFIATALLAPKPNIENAKPGTLGDFNFQGARGNSVVVNLGHRQGARGKYALVWWPQNRGHYRKSQDRPI